MKKPIDTVIVSFEDFSSYEFIPPGSFFIRDATGDYTFFKTSDRAAAQQLVNEVYGKGKYTIVAAKIQKTVSRLESGGLSCYGTATRRGQKR